MWVEEEDDEEGEEEEGVDRVCLDLFKKILQLSKINKTLGLILKFVPARKVNNFSIEFIPVPCSLIDDDMTSTSDFIFSLISSFLSCSIEFKFEFEFDFFMFEFEFELEPMSLKFS